VSEVPIVIDEDKCIGCGKCVDACHRLVYKLEERGGKQVAVPHREQWCLRCFLCVDPCPTKAIDIQFWKKRKKEGEEAVNSTPGKS